jgi:cytidylate kinase
MSADRVIAIDGPAGSGKSTVARTVADKLHMAHLDTGAMYRGVAFAAIEAKIDLDDGDALDALAARVEMFFDDDRIFVDGTDATEAIRGQAVSTAVSPVATNAGVRAELVRRQRSWAEEHDGGVIEGRDIGTAVFPDAPVKVYLTATPDERARRRAGETDGVDVEVLAAQIAERDLRDSTRAVNPMRPADDGVEIDTTEMTLAEVVDEVLAIVPWSNLANLANLAKVANLANLANPPALPTPANRTSSRTWPSGRASSRLRPANEPCRGERCSR